MTSAVLERLSKLLGEWHILIYLVLGFSCAIAGVLWYTSSLQEELVQSSTRKNAQLYSLALADFRTLYTSEVVEVARSSGLEVTHDYKGKPHAIPLPATLSMLLGKRLGEHISGAQTRLYSPYPFPWRAAGGGLRDNFDQAAWVELNRQPDRAYSSIDSSDGRLTLRYATADRMRQACVSCHNSHPASPKRDWKVGDVRGVLEVDLPLDNAIAQVRDNMRGTFWLLSSLALLGTISIGWVIASLKRLSHELQVRVDERTRELRETQSKLVATARQAGMAEIATNVLHNIGNVLNSVNVSADLVADSISKSKVSGLAKAVALVQEHELDLGAYLSSDPRGRLLPAYLGQLSEHLQADQEASVKELNFLRQNIDHIKEVVAMQQTFATASGVEERVDVRELLEDSLRMNLSSLSRHGVEVIREIGEVPPIMLDKHKVLQILVNLVSNARHACDDSGRTDKRLTLRLTSGDGRVRLTVTDNGAGIPAENLTRIFNHGFTTRKGGHGFGLHSGALAAKELGGSLLAQSDGIGLGATFTLELPLTPLEVLA
ncbi:ATP-binding protein [Pseudomonas sp. 2FE]|uniref:ATP-binding protein n=1 Tax=Pseudomonas sp. 2FE TaxID=2502190 RepID=UPI001C49A4E3|nr:ATP-binding protein [Pseudomonas sp. 2FE]